MPFGGLLSLAGPALSMGSSLFGMFGGSPSQNVQMPQGYNYGQMPYADQGAIQGTQQLGNYNVAANLLPQYQQIAQNSVSNPYAQPYLSGAQTAGAQGQGAGASAYGAGGALSNAGSTLTGSAISHMPDVNALLQLGFDPQNALYSKLQNQNQQQNAAILGNSGVAGTPYGAGVQADANSNFNINWEQQQLQRAIQGAQGAGGLMGSIGGLAGQGAGMVGQGQGLQASAAGQTLSGAGMPYNAFQGINANALGTLGQAGQFGQVAAGGQQQQVQDYLAYLGGGTSQQGANNQTAQTGLNQANQTFNQQQQMGSQFGQGLAGMSNAWGKTGWGGGGGGGFANNAWGQANPGAAGSAFYGPMAA